MYTQHTMDGPKREEARDKWQKQASGREKGEEPKLQRAKKIAKR